MRGRNHIVTFTGYIEVEGTSKDDAVDQIKSAVMRGLTQQNFGAVGLDVLCESEDSTGLELEDYEPEDFWGV